MLTQPNLTLIEESLQGNSPSFPPTISCSPSRQPKSLYSTVHIQPRQANRRTHKNLPFTPASTFAGTCTSIYTCLRMQTVYAFLVRDRN